MENSSPFFSIVIPTRNRPDTLRHTLATCVGKYTFGVEVIVFDNSFPNSIYSVFEEVATAHPEINFRYVRAASDLAMSRSWDAAVHAATGAYVTVMGDDDGLIPGGLNFAFKALSTTGAKVARFSQAFFGWPDLNFEPLRSRVSIPLSGRVRYEIGRHILGEVASFSVPHSALPTIYNSFVQRSFLLSLCEDTGFLFSAVAPDVESGFIFALRSDQFLNSSVPVSILGLSRTSNGVSTLYSDPTDGEHAKVAEDFSSLNESQGIAWPEEVPSVLIMPAVIAEGLFRANLRIIGKGTIFPMTAANLLSQCVDTGVKLGRLGDPAFFGRLADYAKRHQLPLEAEASNLRPSAESTEPPFCQQSQVLDLDISDLGLNNVDLAARFIARFYDYEELASRFCVESRSQVFLRKLRSAVSALVWFSRPRPWEIFRLLIPASYIVLEMQ